MGSGLRSVNGGFGLGAVNRGLYNYLEGLVCGLYLFMGLVCGLYSTLSVYYFSFKWHSLGTCPIKMAGHHKIFCLACYVQLFLFHSSESS